MWICTNRRIIVSAVRPHCTYSRNPRHRTKLWLKCPLLLLSCKYHAVALATTSSSNTSSSNRPVMMSSTTASGTSIWDGQDKVAFLSLGHPGYSTASDGATFTGGWLAHRKIPEGSPDWIQAEVANKITKFDYQALPIAYEFARLLELLGCDVRVYNPRGLPVRDPAVEDHIKVRELRALTLWSDGHVWCSPEMHGTVTGVFKNQIDWIPLNTGSVRPTQGRTCCVAQVNGGSQSFNAVNALRLLARWMRMPCCTNQSSVAKAWQEFDANGRMKPSEFRDRVVDVAEEFAKFTAVMVPVADDLTNRYSERKEVEEKGRLLSQAEKEANKK